MKNSIRTSGFGLATALMIFMGSANAAPIYLEGSQGLYVELLGEECIATTCTDLASAGYSDVQGGPVLYESEPNVALKPGSDTGNEGAVSSFNVKSSIDNPAGATDPMMVSNLDSSFGFYWGSVDSYNVVSFNFGLESIYEFSGEHLAELLGTGTSPNYGTDQYVNFLAGPRKGGSAWGEGDWVADGNTFDSVTFYNSPGGVAFEVAAAPVAVPEPAAIGLMGLGLLSLGLARRRLYKA